LASSSIERIDMKDVKHPDRWLTAEEATGRLGVSRQTLYTYVSRSRIGTVAAPSDPRRTLYDAADIARLAKRKSCGRARSAVAASTISYGEPILHTAITRIEGDHLEYRGRNAVVLADHATLEDVAAVLWQVDSLPPTTDHRRRRCLADNPLDRRQRGRLHRRNRPARNARAMDGTDGSSDPRCAADTRPDGQGRSRSAYGVALAPAIARSAG